MSPRPARRPNKFCCHFLICLGNRRLRAGIAARPGDDNVEAGGIAESMVVDGRGNSEESGNPASVGVSATGTANSGGSTEENLDVLLVEAEAQYKAAEEALKGLRDALKREKRKDEKAMADAEKKRNKMKDENGNLPNGKKRVLLVHYDEKWFWGLVLRAFAKACEEIGVKKRDYAAFHRSHINKVMAIAFVAAVFDGSLESGCEVVKLPLVRAQAPKIAERAQYEAVSQPDGSIRCPNTNPDGTPKEPLRRKGESFLVDCCVTGSNEGTKKDPKCSLLLVFKETIFPAILNLVGPGKQYEDCHVIIQGDQAGPHEDGTFTQFVTNFCAEQVWTSQPQAPQMPHANVLDLSVFPAMSRRHSEWARKMVGTSVISTDQIWDTAEDVYDSMPNCKIASAFIQYWRIMGLVIKAGGSNEFVGRLGDENLHTGIRIDFNETAKGMEPSARHPSKKNIDSVNVFTHVTRLQIIYRSTCKMQQHWFVFITVGFFVLLFLPVFFFASLAFL